VSEKTAEKPVKKTTTKAKKPKEAAPAAEQEARTSTRKVREGLVVSNKMTKTVVVQIQRRVQHPLYGKVVIRSNRFKAHDELGCDVGDKVEIMETRPISKEKRWRVTQILEKVK
jgi:small subunit ribosomal protein S17